MTETRKDMTAMKPEPSYVCNLIIPGAAKSGTSSLHEILNRHPNICMSIPKEPQHFSFDNLYKHGAISHNSNFSERQNIKYWGESSQCYMWHPLAIERIYSSLQCPKIIFMLRHPIDRLYSHYASNHKIGHEKRSLPEAIAVSGDDTSYSFDQRVRMYRENGGYLAASRYSHWVPLYQKTFGQENVLILRAEDLFSLPIKTLNKIENFLDICEFPIYDAVVSNATHEKYRRPPTIVTKAMSILPSAIRNNFFYKEIRKNLLMKITDRPDQIDSKEREKLKEILFDDICFYENL